MDTDVLNTNRLATLLGVTTHTARKLSRLPGFPPPREIFGRKRLAWLRADVRRWLASRPTLPADRSPREGF